MLFDTTHLMPTTPRPAAVMVRGKGSHLWDGDGRRYLDFVQGWAVNTLGHAPELLADAICDQARTLIHAGAAYYSGPQLALASALCHHSHFEHVFFCNSGAEANEGAIKLARRWGQRSRGGAYRIVTTQGSFHGRTLATMAASGKPGFAGRFPPTVEGFVQVPFGDAGAVEAAIDDDTVAVMVEPIQGEAGVVTPPAGYLAALAAVCRRRGILLVVDEIQTGVGRTGTLFAHGPTGVCPDIMTLGKGLGGGVPIAAMLATAEVSCFTPGDQGGTFNGNPLATRAALAVVQAVLAEGFLEDVQRRGRELAEGLGRLPGVHDTRGRGLLQAALLAAPVAERVRDACFDAGLLINAPQPAVLRFMPALNVSAQEVRDGLTILARVLRDVLDP